MPWAQRVVVGAVTGLSVADVRAARPDVLSAVARRVEDHRLAVVEVLEVVLRGRSVALSGSRGGPPRALAVVRTGGDGGCGPVLRPR